MQFLKKAARTFLAASAQAWRSGLQRLVLAAASALWPLLPVTADGLDDWNAQAVSAIRSESTAPPLAARNLAMLHIAIYDAVNSLAGTHAAYLTNVPPDGPASAEAAVAGAAHRILHNLFPSQSAAFDAALTHSLALLADDATTARGMALGQAVADLVLGLRVDDGASTTVPYIPSPAPGAWRRTPPYFRPPDLPHWCWVTPFAMASGSQFRPTGPPQLASARYAAELNQVKELGGATSVTRTAEQELIAYFWADFTYTVTPPGHWNQIARSAASSLGLSLAQKARLFALLNIALADAAIAVWDAKYAFNFWRPVTAIQQADLDDNPETVADPGWAPLLNTPSFPEYVSGHSAFSSAAAAVLTRVLGTDHVSFTVISDSVPGVIRSYSSFAATADEIGMSRIYGGIHFLSGDLDGLSLGRAVGDYVNDHFLLPLGEWPRLRVVRLPEGGIRVAVEGLPGSSSILEYSTDLRDWHAAATNALPFVFAEPTVSVDRFYRAKLRR